MLTISETLRETQLQWNTNRDLSDLYMPYSWVSFWMTLWPPVT